MPGRDGRGPRGEGPQSGRGLGRCAQDTNRNTNKEKQWGAHGLGYGHGHHRTDMEYGRGHGWRHRYSG